jgi:hypothetical protein
MKSNSEHTFIFAVGILFLRAPHAACFQRDERRLRAANFRHEALECRDALFKDCGLAFHVSAVHAYPHRDIVTQGEGAHIDAEVPFHRTVNIEHKPGFCFRACPAIWHSALRVVEFVKSHIPTKGHAGVQGNLVEKHVRGIERGGRQNLQGVFQGLHPEPHVACQIGMLVVQLLGNIYQMRKFRDDCIDAGCPYLPAKLLPELKESFGLFRYGWWFLWHRVLSLLPKLHEILCRAPSHSAETTSDQNERKQVQHGFCLVDLRRLPLRYP